MNSKPTEECAHDDLLVPISCVQWVSKNAFVVTVPRYQRKISCELTSVDVPRLSDMVFSEIMRSVIQKVNTALRCYLRQDYYSNFPLEAYGDIIFSCERSNQAAPAGALTWTSLQEEILRAGIGWIVRPTPFRLDALFQAESAAPPQTWLAHHLNFERAEKFRASARCFVLDVLRGDVLRVQWLDRKDEGGALPSILILDCVKCHEPKTAVGYEALRWSQRNLLNRTLSVVVCSVTPCDHDVSNNTQLSIFEFLAHARGSAYYVEEGTAASVNVGERLIRLGLGKVMRCIDAGVPRAPDFQVSLETVSEILKPSPQEDTAAAGAALRVLSAQCKLPLTAAQSLSQFMGETWAYAAGLLFTNKGAGATKRAWHEYMWCGNMHEDPSDEPTAYQYRPLRSILPLDRISDNGFSLPGYVNTITSVSAQGDQGGSCRNFIFVEVMTVTPISVWGKYQAIANFTGDIQFSPSPDEVVYGEKLPLAISFLSNAMQTRQHVMMTVAVKRYNSDQFQREHHQISRADAEAVEGSKYETVLSIPKGDKMHIFVVDVEVTIEDEESQTEPLTVASQACYMVYPDQEQMGDDSYGMLKDDEKDRKNELRALSTQKGATHYMSPVNFAFEVKRGYTPANLAKDAAVCNQSEGSLLCDDVASTCRDLLYKDVVCLPVGVGVVNGTRCLVGDLLLSDDTTSPAKSFISTIGREWWASEPEAWPIQTTVLSSVQRLLWRRLEDMFEEESAARSSIAKASVRSYKALLVSAVNWSLPCQLSDGDIDDMVPYLMSSTSTHDCHDAPSTPIRLYAGSYLLMKNAHDIDAFPQLSARALPPYLPLVFFSTFPRQFFASNPENLQKIAGNAVGDYQGTKHVDWALMRVPLPKLPNAFHTDTERLPHSLRNTERALCESLLGTNPPITGGDDVLFAEEVVMARFLSLLFLLHARCVPKRVEVPPGHNEHLSQVYHIHERFCKAPTSKMMEATQTCQLVLYLIPKASGGGKAPPYIFIGNRDTQGMDFMETTGSDETIQPKPLWFPPSQSEMSRIVSALALETLTSADMDPSATYDERTDSAVLTAARGNVGHLIDTHSTHPFTASQSTPLLYRPVPGLCVLGQPLVSRRECSIDDLSKNGVDGAVASQEKHFGFKYVAMLRGGIRNPYKLTSYGRMTRRDLEISHAGYERRMHSVKTYFSLLLRAFALKDGPERLPDGMLFMYGTSTEPLFAHYRSRQDLRFSLGSVSGHLHDIILRSTASSSAQTEADIEAEEKKLLETFTQFASQCARAIVEKVSESCAPEQPPPCVLLQMAARLCDPSSDPHITVLVYPVDEFSGETDSLNPHQPFDLYGTSIRRLPRHELRITYNTDSDIFTWSWVS